MREPLEDDEVLVSVSRGALRSLAYEADLDVVFGDDGTVQVKERRSGSRNDPTCWACLQVPREEAFVRMLGLCYRHADPADHFPRLKVPQIGVLIDGPLTEPILLIPGD